MQIEQRHLVESDDPTRIAPQAPRTPVVLACGADDAFARPLAVTLYSALANYGGTTPVRLYIVDNGLSANSRARICQILRDFAPDITWVSADTEQVAHLAVTTQYPISVYLRLLLPYVLPVTVTRVLYLDSDVVVLGDIGALWESDMSGYALLAAQDTGIPTVASQNGLSNYRELGLQPDAKYFNSGVLLLDLGRWREMKLAKHVIDYIATYSGRLLFGEQDALNAVLARDWGELPACWNQQVAPWKGYDSGEYEDGILHFVSTFKPWVPGGVHHTNVIYDRYLKRCGWYGPIGWWRYLLPLMVKRQQALFHHLTGKRALQHLSLPNDP